MFDNTLVKTIGEFGIFKSFLDTFNIVNMRTGQIAGTMNFLCIEDAEEYIKNGVSY